MQNDPSSEVKVRKRSHDKAAPVFSNFDRVVVFGQWAHRREIVIIIKSKMCTLDKYNIYCPFLWAKLIVISISATFNNPPANPVSSNRIVSPHSFHCMNESFPLYAGRASYDPCLRYVTIQPTHKTDLPMKTLTKSTNEKFASVGHS
eukprot:sb/3473794/